MVTKSAEVWRSLGTLKPGDEGYRPDIDANFNGDFMEYASPERSRIDTGFYVGDRGLPWHVALSRQLNTPELMGDAEHLLTKKEALVAAGGDFTVALKPIQVAESAIKIPGRFAVVREDTGAPLGVVGRGYRTMQNEELASFADALVDSGAAKYETGGLMRDGAWFFLSMELDGLDIVIPRDPSALRSYLLLRTSHDGSTPVGFYLTQVRGVCANTLDLAQKGALRTYRIRHSGTLSGKIEQARAALGIAFNAALTVKELATHLVMKDVVDDQVRAILEATWPVSADAGEEDLLVKSRHFDRAFELYQTSEYLEGIRGTAWGTYNAVVEYLDHGITYHGRARANDGDARADSILFGASHIAKERALKAALAIAK